MAGSRAVAFPSRRIAAALALTGMLSGSLSTVLAQNPPSAEPPRRLATETSPYLQQHADNPVDWYPWGEDAFAKARHENKLVFLSIGYSSCYWCHVMERLSFSDPEIAAFLNQHFVSIKVDREERPDIDELYMLALQAYLQLSGQGGNGGWPLTMFLTPDALPVAGGTYFPPRDEPGRPGLLGILTQMQTAWKVQEPDLRQSGAAVQQFVKKLAQPGEGTVVPLAASLVDAAAAAVAAQHDPEFGGFDFDPATATAPKFPVPSRIQLLQYRITGDGEAGGAYAEMVDRTLTAMAAGGLWDHLGGGFHRYCVDRQWRIPHFEKLLPDNAQLIEVYLDAYRRTGRKEYRTVVEECIAFVLRDLRTPGGGFASALDAESAGKEGAYYVWTREQLSAELSPAEYDLFAAAYGIANAASPAAEIVLSLPRPLLETAQQQHIPLEELETRLAEMRGKLLAARTRREAVRKDDKVLAGWNGLMIRALARSGAELKRADWIAAADEAAVTVLSRHLDADGNLVRSSRGGSAHIPAFLDDYAYLASGLLALHAATGEDRWLSAARRLTDRQIQLFWDDASGGFASTSRLHESLLVRTRDAFDSALPSPNGVSVQNLVRLARATSNERYREFAQKTAGAFAGQLRSTPANLSTLALGVQEFLHWYGPAAGDAVARNLFANRPVPEVELAQAPRPSGLAANPLVPALKATSEEAALHKQVSALVYLPVDRLVPGTRVRVAVEIKCENGWHINANPPQPDFMIPTKLSLESPGKLQLTEVAYPKGHEFRVAGIDEALSVYEGTVYLTGVIDIPATLQPAAGANAEALTLTVDYQTCNDRTCLRPAKLKLTGQVPLAPPGAVANPANAALFEKLFPPARGGGVEVNQSKVDAILPLPF